MRLTLRTLLAYLDDTLDPATTKQIGEKVAESETARELIERLKKVTRRRRLTTPEMVGDPELDVDPNTVAEYLDNVLSPEKIAELEKLCLDSDVNLVEVAACHQILAVLLSEPAQVPPTAFERMYALVKGPEAIPYKKASRRRRGEVETPPDGHDEADEPLLLGMSPKAGGARPYAWIGLAAALLVGLVTVLYLAFTAREPAPRTAGQLPFRGTQPNEGAKPVPGQTPLQPPATQPDLSLASIPLAASWMVARPSMPGNWLLIFGSGEAETPPAKFAVAPLWAGWLGTRTEDSAPAAPPPEEPAKKPDAPAPGVPPPDPTVVRIGTHAAAPRDSLLFRLQDDAEWKLVRPGAAVESGGMLLALPGYRCELTLQNQLRLELVGNLPLTVPNYFLESAVSLHASVGADLDFTLHRGRVIVSNPSGGVALVRLRFLDQVWDVKLLHPKSEIGVELTGRVPPGSDAWSPHFRMNLVTSGGDVEIRRGAKVDRVPPGKLAPWDNSARAGGELLQIPLAETLPWMNKKAKTPDDLQAALTRFSKRLTDKLGMGRSELAWVKVACQESLDENRPWERAIALFTLGAFDQVAAVVKALDTNERPDVRVRALDTLFHFLGRQPNQDSPLRAALKDLSFNDEDADMVVRLLHGLDQNNRSVVDGLLNNLASPRLAIRELSYFSLHLLVQPADKLAGYDPNGPQDMRDAAVRAIRTRLMGKN